MRPLAEEGRDLMHAIEYAIERAVIEVREEMEAALEHEVERLEREIDELRSTCSKDP